MLSRGSNIRRRRRLLLAAIALLLATTGVVSGARRGEAQPTKLAEWYKGPVRYLMNRSETRLFRQLRDNVDRLAFIRRFWERRDPDPRTPQNEARLAFWSRVAEANRRFDDTPLPGWKTDRGKIFILLGEPDDTEERYDYDTGDLNSIQRGLLRWHYTGLQQAATRAITIIAFVRDAEDWRLTRDPKLNSVFLNINNPDPNAGMPRSITTLASNVPWGAGTLATAMDLGRLQEVPSERDLMRTVVRAEQFFGSYHSSWRADEIVGAGGLRLLALTVAIPRAELLPEWDGSATGLSQRFAVSAELRRIDDPPPGRKIESFVDFGEGSFVAEPAPAEGDPWLRFQSLRPVPAGHWQLSAIVLDRAGGGSATAYGEIAVAEAIPGAPRFTGPILARSIEKAGSGSSGADLPFRLGGLRVIPRMDSRLSPDDPFVAYVGLSSPVGSDAPVNLVWTIEREREDGEFELVGEPKVLQDGRGPRGWNLPPGSLGAGNYRLRFVALAAKGRSERTLTFEVLPAAATPAPSPGAQHPGTDPRHPG